jgi:uncharacterized protein (TIGR03000 family)
MLAAVVVGLGSSLTGVGRGGEGHGGGGGHALGGYGLRGGYAYGFRGGLGYRCCYGYPGWYPFGLGLGLGCALAYDYGYAYYPYPVCSPIYISPGYGSPPAASAPACPVAAQGPAPGAPDSMAPGAPVRLTDTDVLLSIRVAPDAVVRINGTQTTQDGPRREFVSSGLAPGRTYPFVVTARWTGPNGQAVQLEQLVHVQGGERRKIDFLAPPPPTRNLPVAP